MESCGIIDVADSVVLPRRIRHLYSASAAVQETFNPYREWLGREDDRQPSDHYELLGIAPDERDADVIGHAADVLIARVRRVRPTFECFDLGHVHAGRILIKEGLVLPPYHFGLVLGVPGALPYGPHELIAMVDALPVGAEFTVMGIGRSSLPSQFGSIAVGGWIRVGFEDNVYFSKGRLAKSNAELVERAARIAKEAGLELATPDEVRSFLKLRG